MTLEKKLIILPLNAKTKEEAIRALSEKIAIEHKLSFDAIYNAILQREELGSTAIGHMVAIPHCRLENAGGVYTALGVCSSPVNCDGQGVRIFFLVVSDNDMPSQQVRTLSSIASFCNDNDYRSRLLEATKVEQAIALFEA